MSSADQPHPSVTAEELAVRLKGRSTQPGQWTARCPAHEDQQASLSIRKGEDGRVLLYCHAGCKVDAICQALGINKRDLFPPRAQSPGKSRDRRDWQREARRCAQRLDAASREYLATELGVPVAALEAVVDLGGGQDDHGHYFTFPEYKWDTAASTFRICGLVRRYRNGGGKKALPGSKRGLAIPQGEDTQGREGPLLIPEGWSDVLVLHHAGLRAIGRPSATGGVVDLVDYCQSSLRSSTLQANETDPDPGTNGTPGTVKLDPAKKVLNGSTEGSLEEPNDGNSRPCQPGTNGTPGTVKLDPAKKVLNGGTESSLEGQQSGVESTATETTGPGMVDSDSGTGGTAGTEDLACPRNQLILLAENDGRENGHWPGRDGALRAARILANTLGQPIGVAFPPDLPKDARAWFTSQVGSNDDIHTWHQAGQRFLTHVLATVQWVQPEEPPGVPAGTDGPEVGPVPRCQRPAVLLDPVDVSATADRLQQVLCGSPAVFSNGGQLVRLRRLTVYDGRGRLVQYHQTEPLDGIVALDLLSQQATFHRIKGDQAVGCVPPENAVAALLAREVNERVRKLRGIQQGPLLLPDGRLVFQPGYDAETGWFVDPGQLQLPPIPDQPTLEEARQASALLLSLVEEFDWSGPCDQAAWLSFVLTLCCRGAIDGSTPAFAFSAPTPGSGKSLLVRIAVLLATGQEPGMKAFPTFQRGRDGTEVDEEELRKLLYSVALAERSVVVFDNVSTGVAFGGAALDGALTANVVGGRKLGVSIERDLPWRAVIAVTGNQLTIAGDTTRRVVYAELIPQVERPAERSDYRISDLPHHVLTHRAELLAAAFTLVRAYILAGSPAQGLPHYGSFESWNRLIRGAVHWVLGADPLGRQPEMPTENAGDSVAELFRALSQVPGIHQGLTAREILARLKAAEGTQELLDLRTLLAEWAGPGQSLPSERSLGMRLSAFKERIAGGFRFRSRMRDNTRVWVLDRLPPATGASRMPTQTLLIGGSVAENLPPPATPPGPEPYLPPATGAVEEGDA